MCIRDRSDSRYLHTTSLCRFKHLHHLQYTTIDGVTPDHLPQQAIQYRECISIIIIVIVIIQEMHTHTMVTSTIPVSYTHLDVYKRQATAGIVAKDCSLSAMVN